MDKETIDTYNREAESVAQLHSTLIPYRIYELIDHYFIKGGATADIGCGIGRDTHWLNQHGFPSIGIDASEEMLNQARSLYPNDNFTHDCLPGLSQLIELKFLNILCSAVMMHLNNPDLKSACNRFLQLLDVDGCLVISFRGTKNTDKREKGKLYEPININDVLDFFITNGCEVIINESETETLRNLTWHNLVIKKLRALAV
jgi:2-polyprenyl-3-methyl-5-hydroxy-6-metoxy-1,4-benzoquinol methylase